MSEKEMFIRYIKVQLIGNFNMYTQAQLAARTAGLTIGDYEWVMNNYRELKIKYQEDYDRIEKEISIKLANNITGILSYGNINHSSK